MITPALFETRPERGETPVCLRSGHMRLCVSFVNFAQPPSARAVVARRLLQPQKRVLFVNFAPPASARATAARRLPQLEKCVLFVNFARLASACATVVRHLLQPEKRVSFVNHAESIPTGNVGVLSQASRIDACALAALGALA